MPSASIHPTLPKRSNTCYYQQKLMKESIKSRLTELNKIYILLKELIYILKRIIATSCVTMKR